jgi:acyl carrier protein
VKTTVDDEMYHTVTGVLVRIAGVPVDRLAPDTRLDALGLDSLAMLEVGLALQKELGVEIDDAEVAGAQTVSDLAAVGHRALHSDAG